VKYVTITATTTKYLVPMFLRRPELRYDCGSGSRFCDLYCGFDPARIRNSVIYLVAIAMTVPVVLGLPGVPLIHGDSGVGAARCCGGRLRAAARCRRRPGVCHGQLLLCLLHVVLPQGEHIQAPNLQTLIHIQRCCSEKLMAVPNLWDLLRLEYR
jgi:hypothetical protein